MNWNKKAGGFLLAEALLAFLIAVLTILMLTGIMAGLAGQPEWLIEKEIG